MKIKKLENGSLLIPQRMIEGSTVGDVMVEVKPADVNYEKYLEQYEREQKMEMSEQDDLKTILVDAINGFVVETANGIQIFKEMYDLLEVFPNYKILLTGADDEQFKKWGLDKMPYEVFTLKHNPEKTDPKYYETLLQKFGLNKNEVIYFEHNPEAVKTAESIGIKSYYYDHEKRDLEALKKFISENL